MSNALVPTDRVPPTTCVECGEVSDCASLPEDRNGHHRPKAGNVSMGFSCGHLAIYNEDLSLREPTIDEMLAMGRDPKIRLLQTLRAKVMRENKESRGHSAPAKSGGCDGQSSSEY